MKDYLIYNTQSRIESLRVSQTNLLTYLILEIWNSNLFYGIRHCRNLNPYNWLPLLKNLHTFPEMNRVNVAVKNPMNSEITLIFDLSSIDASPLVVMVVSSRVSAGIVLAKLLFTIITISETTESNKCVIFIPMG